MTPIEPFAGRKPDIQNMHAFGSTCFAYVQVNKKLDPRSEEGIFVGYDTNSSAYLVYFPRHNEVQRVRCVKFLEDLQDENDEFLESPSVLINRKEDMSSEVKGKNASSQKFSKHQHKAANKNAETTGRL